MCTSSALSQAEVLALERDRQTSASEPLGPVPGTAGTSTQTGCNGDCCRWRQGCAGPSCWGIQEDACCLCWGREGRCVIPTSRQKGGDHDIGHGERGSDTSWGWLPSS